MKRGMILMALAMLCGCVTPPTARTATVKGVVYSFEGAREGIAVRAGSGGHAVTDADGAFTVEGVRPPMDRLYFELGRKMAVVDVRVRGGEVTQLGPITLADAKKRKVATDLPSLAKLSGVSARRLEDAAHEAGVDPAAWATFFRGGDAPAGATNTIGRAEMQRLIAIARDRFSMREAAALAQAATGLSVGELRAWATGQREHLPHGTDDGVDPMQLVALLLQLRPELSSGLLPTAVPAPPEQRRAPAEAGDYVLFDAAFGQDPAAQHWWYVSQPFRALAEVSMREGAVRLDTFAEQSERAGFFTQHPAAGGLYRHPALPALDAHRGYALSFTVQLHEEDHASEHRAGYSLIVVGDDLAALELGFWRGRVWAHSDTAPLFAQSHAEDAALDCTTAPASLTLHVEGALYTLLEGDRAILSGLMRHYAEAGFPYDTPGFVFFGDDTSSARAVMDLHRVVVTLPGPTSPAPRISAGQ